MKDSKTGLFPLKSRKKKNISFGPFFTMLEAHGLCSGEWVCRKCMLRAHECAVRCI